MSESIVISKNQPKEVVYSELFPQLKSLLEGETDLIANLANVAAALKEVFGWWWVGFYLVKGNELVLGPFQGPVACTRIAFGRGVCGMAWKEKRSVLVPDVNQFPGHIACSSASVSEIVVPVFNENNEVFAVLDVDSERYDVLDEVDVEWLEKIVLMKNLKFTI
ncbi:MAG TPA: GAF domain-containing protein [Paludibacteraceae bacterium]|nr:GAF domain-containing protein [Paludibacteraceae bacterium]